MTLASKGPLTLSKPKEQSWEAWLRENQYFCPTCGGKLSCISATGYDDLFWCDAGHIFEPVLMRKVIQ